MEAVNELVRILDREAVVAEHALFRLKAIEMLLSANEHRFLQHGSEELDATLDRMSALETMRALVCDEIGEALGVQAGACTVSDVLRVTDERQRGELLRAQARLRELLVELERETALSRDLALARVALVRESLERLGGVPGSRYGQDGIVRGRHAPGSFDERL